MKRLSWAAAVAGVLLVSGLSAPASAQGALAGAQAAGTQLGSSLLTDVQYRPSRGGLSYAPGRVARPYYGRPGRVYGRPYYGRPYYGRPYYGGRYYGRRYDDGAAAAAGVIGGLALGALAAGALAQPAPAPVYGGELAIGSPAWYEYCTRRYRSFDPASGTFMGYDGVRRPCT